MIVKILRTIFILLFTGNLFAATVRGTDVDGLVRTAKRLVIESHPDKTFINNINFRYCETMTNPVLPNLKVIVLDEKFEGFIDPPPKHIRYDYVGIDTVKKLERVLSPISARNVLDSLNDVTMIESLACQTQKPWLEYESLYPLVNVFRQKIFNEFVDTGDVIRINDEQEALEYAEFIITVLYQEVVLDKNTEERILIYLGENLTDSLENYFPKTTDIPEGYSVRIFAYPDMYDFHPLYLNVYEYVLKIKRNGLVLEILESDRLPLPDMKEYYSPLAGRKKLKPIIEAKFSDSLAARKCPKCPLPKFPSWAAKDKIVASFKLYVDIKSDGKIFGYPMILKTTGSKWWDNEIIRWLKEKWKWEENPSETEGTITINFDWKEKK